MILLQDLFKEGGKYEQTFVVTEVVYNTFQQCSHDMNRLHTDEAYAQAKGFRDKVMYGNILNYCCPMKLWLSSKKVWL